MKAKIEFHPARQEVKVRSSVQLELLEKLLDDHSALECSAVVLEVAGEHSDPEWIGGSFQYSLELDSDGEIVGEPRQWQMARAFEMQFLAQNVYQMHIPEYGDVKQ